MSHFLDHALRKKEGKGRPAKGREGKARVRVDSDMHIPRYIHSQKKRFDSAGVRCNYYTLSS